MKRLMVMVGVLCWGLTAGAQTVLHVERAAARKNLVAHPAPVYPESAKGVSGEVVVKIAVDKYGHVSAAKAVSGPEMLREAATDAVMKWGFRAFEEKGKAVAAVTEVVVAFAAAAGGESTAKEAVGAKAAGDKAPTGAPDAAKVAAPPTREQKMAQEFFALAETCRTLLGQRADAAEEEKACGAAAHTAEKFGTETRFTERRSAFVYYATALMRANDLQAAELYGTKAVEVVKQGHDDESGASAAYAVRAQAEAFGGDLQAADADLTEAEEFERKALAAEAGKDAGKEYGAAFKGLLAFHAKVLVALGRKGEADGKLAEAGKY